MQVNNPDLEYNEYIERRNWKQKTATPEPKTNNKSGRQSSSQSRKKNDNYDMPNTVYSASGYQQNDRELGEDALTTVRTLRNNMRVRAIQLRELERPVRSEVCMNACDKLTEKEEQLLRLNEQQSNAILNGNTDDVEKIRKKMKQIKEDAVRDSYSDLILPLQEMKALGVDSEWNKQNEYIDASMKPRPVTPEKSNAVVEPIEKWERPASRASSIGRSISRSSTRSKRRPSTSKQLTPIKKGEQTPAVVSGASTPKVRSPRRNERLFSSVAPSVFEAEAVQNPERNFDDPYKLPFAYGSCMHCGEANSSLVHEHAKDHHYKTECKVMNKCKFCSKIILVSQMSDHHLNRCKFVQGRMVSCNKCGLPVDQIDQEGGVTHPLCRGRYSPNGSSWCPLCSVAVKEDKKSWNDHLVDACYNNPRKLGPESTDEQHHEKPEAIQSNQSQLPNSTLPPNARLIDADRLVALLKETHEKNQAEKKDKK